MAFLQMFRKRSVTKFMSFSLLYDSSREHFQSARDQSSPIFFPVGKIVQRLKLDVDWLSDVCFLRTQHTGKHILGHVEIFENGVSKVYTNGDLNTCWRRIVSGKELMHFYDSRGALTDKEEKLKKLIGEIEHRPLNPSEMLISEARARWMALAVFCPESERASVVDRVAAGESHYSVALDYRLPEEYIPSLISDFYIEALEDFGVR